MTRLGCRRNFPKTWARIARAQRAWGFGDCCMLTKGFNFGFGSRTAQPPRSGSFLRRIQNWKIIFTCKNCRFIKVALHGWIHHLRALLKIHFFVNAKSLCAVFPLITGIQFVVFIGFYSNLWVRFSGFLAFAGMTAEGICAFLEAPLKLRRLILKLRLKLRLKNLRNSPLN